MGRWSDCWRIVGYSCTREWSSMMDSSDSARRSPKVLLIGVGSHLRGTTFLGRFGVTYQLSPNWDTINRKFLWSSKPRLGHEGVIVLRVTCGSTTYRESWGLKTSGERHGKQGSIAGEASQTPLKRGRASCPLTDSHPKFKNWGQRH